MAKIIKKSDDPGFFAQGGKTKMFGKGHTGEVESGQSGKSSQGSDNGKSAGEGIKMAVGGGSNRMFGKGHANHKVPGISGKESQ